LSSDAAEASLRVGGNRVRLGLRGRLIASFAAGGLILSVSMGSIAYYTTRHYLVTDRQEAAIHQAYANAALLRNSLASKVPHIGVEVTSLDSGPGSISLLNTPGQWFSTSLTVGRASVPAALRESVANGQVTTETSVVNGAPAFSVGVPLPAVQSTYFLVYNLSDLQHTLRVLLAALAAAAVITTLLGAGLGLLASRRTMKPLTEVSQAAVAIAAGEIDTRLPVDRRDSDLAGLTTSFNEMVDQLQDRFERDARFSSDVSHELRSPLTTLAASLGVLETKREQLDDPGRQALDLMAGDVRRFERLVQDLLEIARTDAGRSELQLDEVAVGELLRHSVDAALRLHRPTSPPTLLISEAVDSARLVVDKRRFERIVGNLFENAEHYAGGVTKVAANLDPSQSSVVITVSDQGPGIPASERSKIFDRFYRGQASGRRGSGAGSGLGLALVAEHVRRLHGSIEVRSGPEDRGSTFVIILPLAPSSEEPS
jgi:signal transduction histidine kinase